MSPDLARHEKHELNEDVVYSPPTINRAITPGGHPQDSSQPAFPVFHRKIANPAPLGLIAFAGTTFILSWYNVGIRDIATPNVIVSMALGFGGLAQFLAGQWEFASGNTFGATAFSLYGAFWLSFAVIFWPTAGVLTQEWATGELESALGIYLMVWFIFSFLMWTATFRASITLSLVFFFLWITFILLAAGYFVGSASVSKAGGAMGLVTAFCAFYTGAAGLLTPDTSYFSLPVGSLARKDV